MTKNEFLSELQYGIEGKLSAEEINDIIADYNDIFENGILEGDSQETIALQLGSPAKIARKILEDDPSYSEKDAKRFYESKKVAYSQNISSLSKRFGAYVIDNLIGSLILAAVIASIFIPFSRHEIVTQTEGPYLSSTATPPSNGVNLSADKGYSAKLYQDKNGLTTKVEVWDSGSKRVFKGSNEEFVNFLDKNGILYPEQFKSRTYVTTINTNPFNTAALVFLLPYLMIFMFLGVGNIFNVIIAWAFNGYTLGKKLFNIKLEKCDGRRLSFGDVFLREIIVKTIGNIITGGLLNIGSFIWACITVERKTVHDLAAKTRVVEA